MPMAISIKVSSIFLLLTRTMQTFRTSKAKENILSRIRRALNSERLPMPFPDAEKMNNEVFAGSGQEVEETFAESFIKLGGKFVFCENEQELLEQINNL